MLATSTALLIRESGNGCVSVSRSIRAPAIATFQIPTNCAEHSPIPRIRCGKVGRSNLVRAHATEEHDWGSRAVRTPMAMMQEYSYHMLDRRDPSLVFSLDYRVFNAARDEEKTSEVLCSKCSAGKCRYGVAQFSRDTRSCPRGRHSRLSLACTYHSSATFVANRPDVSSGL